MLKAWITYIYIWVLCGVCNIYKREGVRQRNDTADLNDPNMYVGDVVAVFRLLLGLTPQRKIFTPPPPRRCAGAAQPYTRLCVCSGSLLTRSKWNINSNCQAGSYILASNIVEFDMPAYPGLYPSFPVFFPIRRPKGLRVFHKQLAATTTYMGNFTILLDIL